jgi:hypothetical protein
MAEPQSVIRKRAELNDRKERLEAARMELMEVPGVVAMRDRLSRTNQHSNQPRARDSTQSQSSPVSGVITVALPEVEPVEPVEPVGPYAPMAETVSNPLHRISPSISAHTLYQVSTRELRPSAETFVPSPTLYRQTSPEQPVTSYLGYYGRTTGR